VLENQIDDTTTRKEKAGKKKRPGQLSLLPRKGRNKRDQAIMEKGVRNFTSRTSERNGYDWTAAEKSQLVEPQEG